MRNDANDNLRKYSLKHLQWLRNWPIKWQIKNQGVRNDCATSAMKGQ